MNMVESTGKTVEDAITEALIELGRRVMKSRLKSWTRVRPDYSVCSAVKWPRCVSVRRPALKMWQ